MNSLRRTQLIATSVLLATIGLLGGLLGRVAWIEKHASAEQLDSVNRQNTVTVPMAANRGSIRLAGGQVIAASVWRYNLFADPSYIMDPTGKTLERWKLQVELNKLKGVADPTAENLQREESLKAQIDELNRQIDDSRTDTEAARQHLAMALAPLLKESYAVHDPASSRPQASFEICVSDIQNLIRAENDVLALQQIAKIDPYFQEPSQQSTLTKLAVDAVLGMIVDNETYRRKDKVTGVVEPSDPTRDSPRRFLWLARDVDDAFFDRFEAAKAELHKQAVDTLTEAKTIKDQKAREAKRAESAMLAHALDGVGFERTVKRVYPMGSMAAHVIGYAATSEDQGCHGVDGLELQFDDLLRGKAGAMELFKDAQRHTIMIAGDGYKPAEYGCSVWLSIDTMIQSIAEKELAASCQQFKAESGVAIVMDPFTGKVLAMASYPTFDVADFPRTPAKLRYNHAVVDPYEAGSVIKPFVMSWAIEHGVVTPNTMINCEGGAWHDPTGRLVRDDYGYGVLSAEDVVVKSVNVGMAKTGWMMGIPMLCEDVHTFGFGGLTGIELPGDSKGILKPEAKWNKGTLTSVSFGYEIAVTPIQLIRAFATFTNGGYLITPRVVDAVELEPGRTVRWEDLAGAPEKKQILTAKTCDTMREIMEQVYIRGTAKSAISSIYRLYGKTGTAHLAVAGAGHYAGDEYNSSFMSGGPVSDPHLVTVMTLHKPDKSLGHFGGIVAAPGATRIMEQSLEYMQVKPDQVEKKAH